MSQRGPIRILIAVDQLANALLWGCEDETLSSRAWKARAKGKRWGRIAVPIIDAVFRLAEQDAHCELSAEWDER